jgi:2-keto-4-pentenoate hydratase/2-oxohepta-3-ene-1,7-dioic acid hydratase in catechol pathway
VAGSWYLLARTAPHLLAPTPSRGLMNVFEHWTERAPALEKLADALRSGMAEATPVSTVPEAEDFLTPLQYPTKVVLIGANYYDHMAKDAPALGSFKKDEKIPTLFFKPPTTTLVSCGKSVRYPSQSEKFDWEVELAAIIGARARRVGVERALDHVAGFAVGIDLSARDWQFHPKHLVRFDLFGGKGFDDSCPLGPKITPARFVQHDRLQLRLWVNGDLKQSANTSDMIWPLAEQISADFQPGHSRAGRRHPDRDAGRCRDGVRHISRGGRPDRCRDRRVGPGQRRDRRRPAVRLRGLVAERESTGRGK